MREVRDMNGVHAPNLLFWGNGKMMQAVGDRGSVTFLHTALMADEWLGNHSGDIENENWYRKLRDGFDDNGVVVPASGNRLIHVRYYHPRTLSLDPKATGQHVVELFSNWFFQNDKKNLRANLWDDPRVIVSLSNEQNLHVEFGEPAGNQWKFHSQEHYERIAAWEIAAWQEVYRLLGNRRKALSMSGALAEGHDPNTGRFAGVPDGHYMIPAVREWFSTVDVVGIHPYAHLDWADGEKTIDVNRDGYWHLFRPWRPEHFKEAREAWDGYDPGGVITQLGASRKFFVSEYGTFTHNKVAKTAVTLDALQAFQEKCAADKRVLGTTIYMWNGTPDHADNILWSNRAAWEGVVAFPRNAATVDVPVPGEVAPVPQPDPLPAPEPEPPTEYVVGSGVEKILALLGENAASDEITLVGYNSHISFTVSSGRKLIVYSEGTGTFWVNPAPIKAG